ncbi:MAG: TrkH family potassium uptake protein [Sedimentibacter sp.]|uniref:TrkH family potassium uptake protein n=1 Tax=Sedimentibacter sp. TaxID=1960295 RepID=UPI0029811D86|nr:TrkH family potassium uptake protein [Sedimentibacter sp.]MDW5299259.1 TrkH family potassium uptake protein [Sedimentibacter sp.]
MYAIKKIKLTYTEIIVFGTFGIILIGGLLLSLPISSREEISTPFMDSLFTAASAFCVTGLVLYDTYTHWSMFGQTVILLLIQIGGLGFMTVITLFSIFLRRKIGLKERRLLMESANTLKIGGIVLLVKKIIIRTIIFESIGATVLTLRFYGQMGLKEGLYNGIFHSVSAFCNAGFDLMGKYGQNSSLTSYFNDITVNLTIMLLIIIGGIGFVVWDDVANNRFLFKKYQLHTKIVLVTTAVLIFGSALIFYLLEGKYSMINMGFIEKITASLFQSVTTRTAGFNTVNLNEMSQGSILMTMLLMVIGGSPGSTAGGIKTTTFIVLLIGAWTTAKQSNEITLFKRRLESDSLKKASAITVIYLFTAFISIMLISVMQEFSLVEIMFEVFSALGTVGLSLGITPSLNILSKIIVTLLMYGGKVGVLSIAIVLAEKKEPSLLSRPLEKIIIG